MKELIFGIWIGIQGCIDYKYKEIPLWLSLLGGGIGVIFCIYEGREWTNILLACVPGILALVFSFFTQEVMGYGDGIVFVVMGIFMSVSQILSIGMIAFILAGVVALALLVVFRKRGNYQIPFIPFLAVAYGIDCISKWGGFL